MSLRLIIAEDHEIVREGLCSLLEKEPGIEIVAAAEDNIYLSPKISNLVVEALVYNDGHVDPSGTMFLSGREREVLQLLAEGKSLKNIADKFFLSVKTIETHKKNMMKKLNLNNLPELTKYAIRHGLTILEY